MKPRTVLTVNLEGSERIQALIKESAERIRTLELELATADELLRDRMTDLDGEHTRHRDTYRRARRSEDAVREALAALKCDHGSGDRMNDAILKAKRVLAAVVITVVDLRKAAE